MIWVVVVLLWQHDDQLKIGLHAWKSTSYHWPSIKGGDPKTYVGGLVTLIRVKRFVVRGANYAHGGMRRVSARDLARVEKSPRWLRGTNKGCDNNIPLSDIDSSMGMWLIYTLYSKTCRVWTHDLYTLFYHSFQVGIILII